jgi:hypothetical protein
MRTEPGVLELRYEVIGDIAGLRLPPPAPPGRADELWRHTCLEAFVRGPEGEAYLELNFSPSGQWAAWWLEGYRQGMAPAPIAEPDVRVRTARPGFQLAVRVALDQVAGLPPDAAWRLGLSAVIEAADGQVSYWALAHPPGRPDFHHADCFARELVAPGRT